MDKSHQIELLNLQAGKLRMSVAPQVGGSIASFTTITDREVVDIFRPLRQFDYDPRLVLEMGCFPLVPYSNRIRGGKFYANDRLIEIPNNCHPDPHPCHGNGWQNSWNVQDVSSNFAQISLEPDHSLPIQYSAQQLFKLTSDTLEITLRVQNECSIPFPAGLGLHPYFSHKSQANITADIPNEWRLDEESMPVNVQANPDFVAFLLGNSAYRLKEMSAYADWNGHAKIHWPSRNIRVTISTKPKLSHLLMWGPPNKDFFCVEPVSHAIDGFNLAHKGYDNVGGVMLAPGATYSQKFAFTVESS